MSDTTAVDPGVTTVPDDPSTINPALTTVIDPLPTTAVEPGTTFVDPGTVAPAPSPTNEAVPTTFVVPTVLVTSASIFPSTIPSSTLLTSTRSSSTSSDSGSPFNGPPPFVTGGSGRPPFASGSGPPFFNNDDDREGLSGGAKAGIGVGVVALVFSVAAVVLLLWRMKKKKESGQVWGTAEPLPPYTESTTSVPSATVAAGGSPAVEMKPKSAMKKTSPAPLLLNLRGGEGNDSQISVSSTERRRSYAMEGSDAPLVLSIWEPANRSSTNSLTNSPVIAPAPPPKVHRKSNAGSRPRRKSNLAPVSEEEGESSGSRLAHVRDDDASSRPGTPRTPRSAAFHALTGDDNSTGQPSPMDASFTLEPVPPLPGGNVSPVSSKFSDKGK